MTTQTSLASFLPLQRLGNSQIPFSIVSLLACRIIYTETSNSSAAFSLGSDGGTIVRICIFLCQLTVAIFCFICSTILSKSSAFFKLSISCDKLSISRQAVEKRPLRHVLEATGQALIDGAKFVAQAAGPVATAVTAVMKAVGG